MRKKIRFYWDEVSIRSICKDLLRNWWLILMAAVIMVLGISFYSSVFHTAEYTASATLVVSSRENGSQGSTYASLSTTKEMAGVFQEVFQSDVLKTKVQEELGKEKLNVSITASVIPETNLLNVYATGSNPKEAYTVMLSVLKHYPETSEYMFNNAVLEVLKSPEVPYIPSNILTVRKYMVLGAVVGVMLMTGIIVLFSVFRETVKTESAAKRRLKGQRLALIGHEEKKRMKLKKAKKIKSILLTNPVTSFGYVESFRRLAFNVQYKMEHHDEKLLLVSSVTENEGKSTVASNLALALSQKGKKVVLFDLDLRRPALHKIFDKKAEASNFQQLLSGKAHIEFEEKDKLFMILNDAPNKNPAKCLNSRELKRLLEEAREAADYVIIDSPPVIAAADAELMTRLTDASLLVVRQDWAGISDINNVIKILDKSNNDFLGYVLNNFENKTLLGGKQYNYGYGKKYGYYSYGYKVNQEKSQER